MKIALKIVLFLSIIIFSLLGIVFFRDVPAVKIWDNYCIFYVDKEISILDALSNIDTQGVISKETQEYVKPHSYTPIMMDYKIKNLSSNDLRDVFFSDMEDKYQLFYVEESFVESVANELQNQNIPFGVDAKASVPILCPIICGILLIILTVFTKSKLQFILAKIPFVVLAYAVPFYSVAISVCCFLCFLFLFENYVIRENWWKSISKKTLMICFFAICLLMFMLCGIRAFLLFVLACAAWYCCLQLPTFFTQNVIFGFSMKQILPLKYIKVNNQLNLKYTCAVFGSVLVLFLVFCFSGNFKANLKENNLFLPSPSEYTDSGFFTNLEENYTFVKNYEAENQNSSFLPNIFDFVDENWINTTYPFTKLDFNQDDGKSVELGDVISIPEYKKTTKGLVIQDEKVLFTFDENYISNSLEKFEKASGVEKLLSSQFPYSNIVYSAGGKVENSVLMWIVGIIGLVLTGFYTLFCVVKRQKR